MSLQKKGWVTGKGEPVKNKEDLMALDEQLTKYKDMEVKYVSVLTSSSWHPQVGAREGRGGQQGSQHPSCGWLQALWFCGLS